MQAIIMVLLCVIGFSLYLLNDSKNEILKLKEQIHERDIQIIKLQTLLRDRNIEARETLTDENNPTPPQNVKKRFVQVVFNPDSKKCYDYFLGNNPDVKVGDFVEVYVSNNDNGKPEWAVAKVVYLSDPGETSDYAKSKIKRKSDRKKW